MSGLAPNTTNIELIRGPVAIANQLVTHPEYQYWRPDWQKIRDALAGQREIKRKGERYLPKLKGSDQEDYAQYLSRAVFYNMAAQTQNGMIGQIFRRDPKLENLPTKFTTLLNRVAKDNTGIINFTKTAIAEQIGIGRFGILVDAPAELQEVADSYLVGYTAENILDWRMEEVNGRYQLTRVLLREFVRKNDARYFSPYTYDTLYRELLLQEQDDGTWVYRQNTYFDEAPPVETVSRPANRNQQVVKPKMLPAPASGKTGFTYQNGQPVPTPGVPQPVTSATPNIRGNTLDYIPFVFLGSQSNTPDVEKPPMLDIVDLNISHYRSYAELEHGRFYVAMPVYYAPGKDDEGAGEYHIGPNLVWEVPSGETPGILEFKGEGLKTLERALEHKEQQIAAIGGRLLAGQTPVTSESSEQAQLRGANEYSLLLNVIMAAECGLTLALRWWMAWRDTPLSATETFSFRINTDFMNPPIGAREMRAIQLMYEAGLIGIDILYDYLRKADVIPPDTTLEDFKKQIEDPNSFIGQPDVQAMRRGYASRAQELDQATLAREHDFQQQELDLQNEELELQKKAAVAVPPVPKPVGAANPVVGTPGLTPGPKPAPKVGSGKEKNSRAKAQNANPSAAKK